MKVNNCSRFERRHMKLTEPLIKEHEAIKQMGRTLDKNCYNLSRTKFMIGKTIIQFKIPKKLC